MRRTPPLAVALLVLLAPGVAHSTTLVPDGYEASGRRALATGVEHTVVTREDPASTVNVARIAPDAPVELRVVNSDNRIAHHDERLETPSSMCRRVRCIVGVNADFHYVSDHEPYGGVVSGGRMVRSPMGGRPQFTITKEGTVTAGPLAWTGKLNVGTASLSLAGINTTRHADGGIVVYTPDWGPNTEADDATELVVRAAGPVGLLGQGTAVELVSLESGGDADIPPGGAVLSATGPGATALAELWRHIQAGRFPDRGELLIDSPVDAAESVGGNPMLLSRGEPAYPAAGDGFTKNRNPRTVVGWNNAGEVFLVTVDGRQEASRGMGLPELAAFVESLGATDALNLDGGGGTTFVVDGVVTNTPVDDGHEGAERGAVSTLVVVPAAAPATPGPAPGGGPAPGSSTTSGSGTAQWMGQVASDRSGYWMVSADGSVHTFGDAEPFGSAYGFLGPFAAVDLEPTPSGGGYWIVDDIGRVYAFGDARHLGNADLLRLVPGERVTSLSSTPSGYGYWLFTSRGRVMRYGDAPFHGDMSATTLNGPVLDSIPTPSGRGYYMVAADGGIFAFGDARFSGSMGGIPLNAPVQSLVPDPDRSGYWLVASDGGVFAFDAAFRGSMGGVPLARPVSGMVPYGDGYLMVAEDGGIFNFSGEPFAGSLGDRPPASGVVAVAVSRGSRDSVGISHESARTSATRG